MNLLLKVAIFASLMYAGIFIIASFYGHYFFSLPKAAINASTLYTQRTTYAGTPGGIELILGELIAGFVVITLEFKYHVFSKHLGRVAKWFTKDKWHKAVAGLILLAMFLAGAADTNLIILSGLAIIIVIFLGVFLLASFIAEKKAVQLAYGIGVIAISFILVEQIKALWLMAFVFVFMGVIWYYRKNMKLSTNLFSMYFCVAYSIFMGILFNFEIVVLILIVASIYDLVAVLVTKHMLELASSSLKAGVPAVFLFGNEKEIEKKITMIKEGRKADKKVTKGINASILGNGDIILPSCLIVSLAYTNSTLAPYALIGAIVGIFANMWVLSKKRTALPALPLLCIGQLFLIGVGILL